jgi:hypothetical protein
MSLPPFQDKKKAGRNFSPGLYFCENLKKPYKVYYMGDCGSSSAGKGRPALPDQPEEKEEDPLPMPNRI